MVNDTEKMFGKRNGNGWLSTLIMAPTMHTRRIGPVVPTVVVQCTNPVNFYSSYVTFIMIGFSIKTNVGVTQ